MISNIVYIASIVILFIVLLISKKGKEKQNLIVWLPILFITIELIQAFYIGIIRLLNVKAYTWLMAIINIVISVVIWFLFIHKKEHQEYSIDKIDLIFFIAIILYGVYFCLTYFGKNLDIKYSAVDAAAHMLEAKTFALTGATEWNKYFAVIFDAMAMRLATPFIDEFYLYKIFNLTECYHYIISGMMFYSAARIFTQKLHARIILPFLTFIYLLAFPLYSVEFGFVYFTASISIISYIIACLFLMQSEEIDIKIAILLLNLSLFGLFVCYTLFIPVVFVAVFLVLGIHLLHKKIKIPKVILLEFLTFIIPCVLGISQSSNDVGQISGGGLTLDGGCYADLYSNYLLIAPLFLLGIYFCFKQKNHILSLFFILQLGFMAIFFIGAVTGKVSAYYYMKNNNFFWLICFLLVVFAIENSSGDTLRLAGCQLLIIGLLLVSIFIHADEKIINRNSRLISSGSGNFVNIYSFSRDFYGAQPFNPEVLDLYKYIDNNPDLDNGIAVGNDGFVVWAHSLIGTQKDFVSGDSSDFVNKLDGNEKYVIVINSDVYYNSRDYFDNLGEIVYGNGAGYIERINDAEN